VALSHVLERVYWTSYAVHAHSASRGLDACRPWRPAVSPATSSCTRHLNSKQTRKRCHVYAAQNRSLAPTICCAGSLHSRPRRSSAISGIWHQRGCNLGTMSRHSAHSQNGERNCCPFSLSPPRRRPLSLLVVTTTTPPWRQSIIIKQVVVEKSSSSTVYPTLTRTNYIK
jgi:hypothetical protein